MLSMDQDPLFLVFLYLRKSNDILDHGHILKTLEGYGVGPKMGDILAEFWVWQEVCTQKNGYHGPQFKATRRTTQGGLTPPTLFNVVVENVVRYWLYITVEYDSVIHNGLGQTQTMV